MPEIYDDRPHITPDFTYDGCDIVWHNTPDDDRQKFIDQIELYEDSLRTLYRIETDFGDETLMLRLRFKRESTSTDRQIMKGVVFMIIGDTVWGGGPG